MGRYSTGVSAIGAGRPPPRPDLLCSQRQSRLPDPPKKKKKWKEVEAGVMCKWNLHRGGEVEAMRTRWYGSGSEEELWSAQGGGGSTL